MQNAPLILWFRRDLRLHDHPMIAAALKVGRPVIPVFILDPETEALGAAAKWRLGRAIAAFSARLAAVGSRLILRRGAADSVLRDLLTEVSGAGAMWQRMYDPASVARDTAVKVMLKSDGLIADSHPGGLLIEPWQVQTGAGGPYRVYSPFWRAVMGRDFGAPITPPQALPGPDLWPDTEDLADWRMDAAMARGGAVVARHACVGEAAALARLDAFLPRLDPYKGARDFMGAHATSNLSENLAWGEISPRQIWAQSLPHDSAGAEHFRKELVWREFAYHLMHHTPHILTRNWNDGWDHFPWRSDCDDAEAWRRGRTGEPIVDAAMREVYVTGRMHNRARMIVASYLTKHLLVDWRVGQDWFADVLTDWDPASNAMGWQWVAGCGPDAAPYFRVFNPATQAEKFDPDRVYRRRWLDPRGASAQDFYDAIPKSWGMNLGDAPALPLIDLAAGRARALDAYSAAKA